MNREDIRNEIRRLVRDNDSNNYRWSTTVLNDRIDDSQERIAVTTGMLSSRITDGLDSGVAEYDLPTTFLQETSVQWKDSNNEWFPLTKKTESELDIEQSGWRNETGSTPTAYYIRRSLAGLKIGIFPIPSFTSTGSLRIDFLRRPTAFTDDTSVPFEALGEYYAFHEVICYDVAAKCMMDERDFAAAKEFEARAYELKMRIKAQVNSKAEMSRMPSIYEQVMAQPRRTR